MRRRGIRVAEAAAAVGAAARRLPVPRGTMLVSLRVLASAGVLSPDRPDRLLQAALALRRWGISIPGGVAAAAARDSEAVALIDDRRRVTWGELDARTDAIAAGLGQLGVGSGSHVAVLCRNHAGFVEALVAVSKTGADVLLLNTGFAGPQLREVLERERADLAIHDAEFGPLFRGSLPGDRRIVAWSDADRPPASSLDRIAERHAGERRRPPRRQSRLTILTSGTTGSPKGATRSQPRSLEAMAGILSRIPFRSEETTLLAAPLFHAWGLANLGLAVVLRSTLLLQREFDPEALLAAAADDKASAVVAVPVMLRRLLEVPPRRRRRRRLASLRIVAVSGSALMPELAAEFMDAFGDILYNLYGSTEAAVATIATPHDLRAAPGTAGRPPLGTTLRIAAENGEAAGTGETGRILVRNDLLFEGYTSGADDHREGQFVATGDMGCVDRAGRLFIAGRSDDMIVSGGENVYPAEVEELLLRHQAVADAAVVGIDDPEWGQRLRAYIVRRGRSRLDESTVKQYVRSRLARYKVPRDVVFVDDIPRNTAGKVMKGELAGR